MLLNENLELSSSLQDYLEAILELEGGDIPVRVTDIANKLGIAKASVNQAIRKFKFMEYIEQQVYGPVKLTQKGREAAKRVKESHRLLKIFLEKVLGVEPETAEKDACMMEHVISNQTFEKIGIYLFEKGYMQNVNITKPDVSKTDMLKPDMSKESMLKPDMSKMNIAKSDIQNMNITKPDDTKRNILKTDGSKKLGIPEKKPENPEKTGVNSINGKETDLSELKTGEKALVIRVSSSAGFKKRLAEMGLIDGAKVTVKGFAPLGDPMVINLRGFNMSLRKKDAKNIIVIKQEE